MAQTHFILPSDIELYPSPNLITKFLTMVAENKGPLLGKNPKVYPLHLFEVSANQQVNNSHPFVVLVFCNYCVLDPREQDAAEGDAGER